MLALTYIDRTTALRLARALGRSSHYTRGGRPPLPRCDSPKNNPAASHGPGRHPACPCPAADQPVRGCPYLTTSHQAVDTIPTGYAVRVDDPVTQALDGATIDVDGVDVTIDLSAARTLTRTEEEGLTRDWDGRSDV